VRSVTFGENEECMQIDNLNVRDINLWVDGSH